MAKVPDPFDVQVTAEEFVELEPVVIFTAPAFEQVVTSVPAIAVGVAVIVNVLVETAFPQGEFPVAVKVNVLLPAVISTALGVYVQVVSEFAFVKVPDPFVVQVTAEEFVELEPAVIFTAPEFEQVITVVPAIAAAVALTLIVRSEIEEHPPTALVVKRNVTLPL